MSSNCAIQVQNVSKLYQLYDKPQDRLKQSILPRLQALARKTPRQYYREFWALRNISFEVEKGETMGIVGRNGSGKSTLLQIIAGTLTPTLGTVKLNGRLTALLELGSGFNPEFTGRENVYLAGSIMGFSRQEMDNWFDDIAAFADIGAFMDQQVKFYSSGMYVRLAFATNIMVQPDIMIVDEALAVGDMKFQVKCMSALRRRQDSGATILFVSHDINAIRSLCTRAIYLDAGQMRQIGPAVEIANAYFKAMREEIDAELTQIQRASLPDAKPRETNPELPNFQDAQLPSPEEMHRFEQSVSMFRIGKGGARILYADLLDDHGQPLELVEFNQSVWIRILFETYEEKQLTVNFYIKDDKSIPITGSNLALSNHPLLHVKPGERFLVKYRLAALPLQDGLYSLNVSLFEPTTSSINAPVVFVDYIENAVVFNIAPRSVDKIWAKVFLFPSVEISRLD
ncbi:MAG: ABC transporter ATP-binding protein [Anaerolineales bacterium]